MLQEAPEKSALNYLEIEFQIEHKVLTLLDEQGEKIFYNKTLGSERWMLTKSFIEEYNEYNTTNDYSTRHYTT